MSSKDSSVFEVRKHNDFSALLSSDDEDQKSSSILESAAFTTTSAPVVANAADDVNSASAIEDDGFETFSTTRKPKRQSFTKMTSRLSTGLNAAPFVAGTSAATATKPHTGGFPKELIIPKIDNSIELYDFPSTLKTGDLRKFLHAYEGHFRLKWNNDTSCYAVFDDVSLVERALSELKSDEIKIKPFVEVSSSSTEASN